MRGPFFARLISSLMIFNCKGIQGFSITNNNIGYDIVTDIVTDIVPDRYDIAYDINTISSTISLSIF